MSIPSILLACLLTACAPDDDISMACAPAAVEDDRWFGTSLAEVFGRIEGAPGARAFDWNVENPVGYPAGEVAFSLAAFTGEGASVCALGDPYQSSTILDLSAPVSGTYALSLATGETLSGEAGGTLWLRRPDAEWLTFTVEIPISEALREPVYAEFVGRPETEDLQISDLPPTLQFRVTLTPAPTEIKASLTAYAPDDYEFDLARTDHLSP